MTTMTTTTQVIADFILKEFLVGEDPSLLTEDTELVTSGILDSLAVLRLVVFIEDELGVTLPPDKVSAKELNTISSICALIEALE